MSGTSLSLRSIANHERDHKGHAELAGVLDAMADHIERQDAEIERLQRDERTYRSWADEIKLGVEELRAEIERLRMALEKIAGRREFDKADYDNANLYKPSEGLWTVEEYIADAALAYQQEVKTETKP